LKYVDLEDNDEDGDDDLEDALALYEDEIDELGDSKLIEVDELVAAMQSTTIIE